jgi:hypothetical protein
MSSKAEYLKKYMSGGDGTGAEGGKVKKLKKVKKDAGGLTIVDNDFDWRTTRREDDGTYCALFSDSSACARAYTNTRIHEYAYTHAPTRYTF